MKTSSRNYPLLPELNTKPRESKGQASELAAPCAAGSAASAPWRRRGEDLARSAVRAPRFRRHDACCDSGNQRLNEVHHEPERLPPTYRLQDELHLLRDSLGAVDAHYEAALDGLQHARAYEDDSQIDRLIVDRGEVRKADAGLLVTITG